MSVGSLPGNLKSHILKTIQFDHLRDKERPQPMDVSSDSLNKIPELPEEDQNLEKNRISNTINGNDFTFTSVLIFGRIQSL